MLFTFCYLTHFQKDKMKCQVLFEFAKLPDNSIKLTRIVYYTHFQIRSQWILLSRGWCHKTETVSPITQKIVYLGAGIERFYVISDGFKFCGRVHVKVDIIALPMLSQNHYFLTRLDYVKFRTIIKWKINNAPYIQYFTENAL